MQTPSICRVGTTPAVYAAAEHLRQRGFTITHIPGTDTRHVLLDVPSFDPSGNLRSGEPLQSLLTRLPSGATLYGGNFGTRLPDHFRGVDLLQQEDYLAQNAAITAECTLKIALPKLISAFSDTPTLIIGWGRIGKCLSRLLRSLGFPVTVSARKESDRSIAQALGYRSVDISESGILPDRYRMIINTVPHPILDVKSRLPSSQCLIIDLASRQGITGEDVLWATGLPGVLAPEASGVLIGNTVLKLWKEDNQ